MITEICQDDLMPGRGLLATRQGWVGARRERRTRDVRPVRGSLHPEGCFALCVNGDIYVSVGVDALPAEGVSRRIPLCAALQLFGFRLTERISNQ